MTGTDETAAPLSVLAEDVGARCVSFASRRAARVASRAYDEALKPLGLTIGQVSILTALALHQPIGLDRLAWGMAMERTTLLRNLRPLERAGLIRRTRAGRAHRLHLTEAGAVLYRAAYPRWREVQERLEAALPEGGWQRAGEALGALSRHAQNTAEGNSPGAEEKSFND